MSDTPRVKSSSPIEKASLALISRFLSRIRRGKLEFALPDGRRVVFGGAEPGVDARIRVRDWAFFPRLVAGGDIGLGESYEAGLWDSDDLTAAIRVFVDNEPILADNYRSLAWVGRTANRALHLLRKNTRGGSRRNIRDHYDLGNEFFQLFLDPTMMYSCALYKDPEETLESAQRNKLRAILAKARIQSGQHVLEIGSGWGSFAVFAAKETGCRVTSITLSEKQLTVALERAQAEKVDHLVRFELCDYRDIQGVFDRIVSIEMIEAVGHEYLPIYFRTIDRLLKPDGIAVIQAITVPDQRYEVYRRSCDWIQKRIFPGAVVPSLTAITQAITQGSSLVIDGFDNIGVHYARTLSEWRARLEQRAHRLAALGFDDAFLRAWRYYFSYCEAGFAARVLGDLQLVLTRVNNPNLPGIPVSESGVGSLAPAAAAQT